MARRFGRRSEAGGGVVALIELPEVGIWLWVWAIVTNVITFRRLFTESLPEFFQVLRKNLYLRPSDESVQQTEQKEF